MYNAKIETNEGYIVNFGYEYGTVFTIDPLNGVDVDLNKSQGFGQIGETVVSQTVQGVSREITGTIFRNEVEIANTMMRRLSIYTRGRLFFNNDYFCDITISKTPYVSRPINGKCTFSIMVFCDTPFWKNVSISSSILKNIVGLFRFPVVYDSHKFGEKDVEHETEVINDGDMEQPIFVTFYATGEVHNPVITNSRGEKIKLDITLQAGDIVELGTENNVLYLRQTRDNVTSDIFYALNEESNLFMVHIGSNSYKINAETGEENIIANVSFYPAHVGIIDEA